ncbi:MAG: hypothetical protein A3G24_11290 [Betaproteobacteria bacterium RIFCSPLOWO2_12_FULL_62_13]|nr:MAG: hypothetical protein A3G24_11290 [Betaproteobacteria bacterium RIFCSPLOWO2_12_FULL_62_13]
MLTGQRFRIVHNTKHTPQEFGKDVIAVSPEGKLVGYQLKGNPSATLTPHQFDEIRSQLEQLATLALGIPGYEGKVPDACYLVTNGEVSELVSQQIQLLNASLVARGHPSEQIKMITRGTLLAWSKDLGLALWPSEMEDFGNLVKLLNFRGDEMFPAQILDPLLRHTLCFDKEVKSQELSRRVTSAAVMTAVALHSFSRRKNHFAEITAWTMFITYSIAACEKNGVDYLKHCKEAVLTARDGIYDLLGQLCEEASERKIQIEGDPYSEFAFYRPRVLLMSALMAIYWMWSEAEIWKRPHHKSIVEKLISANLPQKWLWGEGAIPNFLTFIWYSKKIAGSVNHDMMIATVLAALLQNKTGAGGGEPLASPYYDAEEVVQHQYRQFLGCQDPFEGDGFEGASYFCESLMMCLVRSNLKPMCQQLWPDFTKLSHERVVPDQPWQFGLYRTGDAATNETQIYPPTVQWSELQEICREHAAADVPEALKADPILLLLFVNVFPFRASFSAMKFLHREFDQTAFL